MTGETPTTVDAVELSPMTFNPHEGPPPSQWAIMEMAQAETSPAPALAPAPATYHFYDESTGLFSGASFTGLPEEAKRQLEHRGPGVGMHCGDVDYMSQKYVDGAVVDFQPIPPWNGEEHLDRFDWVWNAETKRWTLSPKLTVHQESRWDDAKQARAAALAAPLVTAHGTFDAGESSRVALMHKVLAMQITGATSADWTLADNSHTTLTLAQLVDVVAALDARTQAAQDASQAQRQAIAAAGDVDELHAIAIDGFPPREIQIPVVVPDQPRTKFRRLELPPLDGS